MDLLSSGTQYEFGFGILRFFLIFFWLFFSFCSSLTLHNCQLRDFLLKKEHSLYETHLITEKCIA